MNTYERELTPMRVLNQDEEVAQATPYFDWEFVWNQFGIGVAVCPRREYGIDFWFGPVCLTVRWRHGWLRPGFEATK